ncbi:hypothetical protein KAURM247S_03298 [Kitasatospora aureofaciens]
MSERSTGVPPAGGRGRTVEGRVWANAPAERSEVGA